MVHIFDVDHTVIRNTSAWYFLREAFGKGIIRFSQVSRLPFEWIRYRLGRPNMDFIEDAVKSLAGIDKNILEQAAQSCFDCRIQANIYAEAARLIGEALKRGEKAIFATSSLQTIIWPLERFLGIEGSIASKLEFIDGRTSGRLMGSSAFGQGKKAAVEAWLGENGISPGNVCFYSDSYTDLPLLEFCGRPVAVNPDRVLAREARKRGWEIMRFSKTLGIDKT